MHQPENTTTTLDHLLALFGIAASFLIGAVICGVLVTILLHRHFAWQDAHPHWYERNR